MNFSILSSIVFLLSFNAHAYSVNFPVEQGVQFIDASYEDIVEIQPIEASERVAIMHAQVNDEIMEIKLVEKQANDKIYYLLTFAETPEYPYEFVLHQQQSIDQCGDVYSFTQASPHNPLPFELLLKDVSENHCEDYDYQWHATLIIPYNGKTITFDFYGSPE
tara:strand:+ start:486 stop:974 length:489 start_codon:yes stop_codon:yes gene_type:complete